ncbi:hypothetical protein LINPERPRIM_LOCUS22595 [Linum perenne]
MAIENRGPKPTPPVRFIFYRRRATRIINMRKSLGNIDKS